MRKGRSQRKNRQSLPPTSRAGTARPDGSSSGPQVVIGLSGPTSERPKSTDALLADGNIALEIVPAPSAELLRDLETTTSEPVVTPPADGDAAKHEGAAPTEDANAASSVEAPAAQEPAEKPRGAEAEVPARGDADMAGPLEASAKHEGPSPTTPAEDTRAAEATAPVSDANALDGAPVSSEAATDSTVPHVLSVATPSAITVPPAGDLSTEPTDDHFFSSSARELDDVDLSENEQKARRKAAPDVVQRRARFARYVTWAVSASAVVCMAALVRTGFSRGSSQQSAVANARATETPAVVAPTAEIPPVAKAAEAPAAAEPAGTAEAATPGAAPVADEAKPADVVKADDARSDGAQPAAAKADDANKAAEATGVTGASALEEKVAARKALERNKLADAIAAGERSVALDPTDGEAWLILGAAYQEKGNAAEARRCYSACVKPGNKGPVAECRAMLR